jgi:hypothetical protein
MLGWKKEPLSSPKQPDQSLGVVVDIENAPIVSQHMRTV